MRAETSLRPVPSLSNRYAVRSFSTTNDSCEWSGTFSGIGGEGGAGTWAKVAREVNSNRAKITKRRNIGIAPFVSYSRPRIKLRGERTGPLIRDSGRNGRLAETGARIPAIKPPLEARM